MNFVRLKKMRKKTFRGWPKCTV